MRLALELAHQGRRCDRDRLAAEGEQPSREGVDSADRELSAIRCSFDCYAQLGGRTCCSRVRVEVNEGVFGVSVA